ncbi:MAG: putative toxin-antitoxin system toxin component, PIN family [Oscillatoria sp. PMC 1068.18]|nr:putative toxin-antitoxin system toxin component, PIN family [Oscillatoria sp. PMC 1076.18]MEC4987916.1 putative toxin-antitoxin system toxin component, PIN family [Oscillatoria sp. PMC 1068.18]
MNRVVLDTGVLIAALISKNTPPDQLYEGWRQGAFLLLTSQAQADEFARVIQYPKLQRFLSIEEGQTMLATLMQDAVCVENIPDVKFSPDPDDDKILATAIAGQANYIVSGDKRDLLTLKQVEGIPILSPRQALEVLL